MVEQRLVVVREGYEQVLNNFLGELKGAEKNENTFTEFEALMPELVRFILPDKKCRIVLEYDPAEPRVELRREIQEITLGERE